VTKASTEFIESRCNEGGLHGVVYCAGILSDVLFYHMLFHHTSSYD